MAIVNGKRWDNDLQMVIEPEAELSVKHLIFYRWLVETEQLKDDGYIVRQSPPGWADRVVRLGREAVVR